MLIWRAYKGGSERVSTIPYHPDNPTSYWRDTIDVDLDSDGGIFVYPNDIINSKWVQPAFRVSDKRPSSNQIPRDNFDAAVSYVGSGAFRLPMKLSMLQ